MKTIRLSFYDNQLTEVRSRIGLEAQERVSVRGKTSGALYQANTFQWTSAVRALSILLIAARIEGERAVLAGEHGSAIASLDYAISKAPCWLVDMFGTDASGIGLARRLIRRSNPERKRPGPVLLSLNHNFLDPSAISVESNGELLHEPALLIRLRQHLDSQEAARTQTARHDWSATTPHLDGGSMIRSSS